MSNCRKQCDPPLVEIDHWGERLTGCPRCNHWQNGADLRLTTSWRFVRSKPQRPSPKHRQSNAVKRMEGLIQGDKPSGASGTSNAGKSPDHASAPICRKEGRPREWFGDSQAEGEAALRLFPYSGGGGLVSNKLAVNRRNQQILGFLLFLGFCAMTTNVTYR